MRSRRVGGFRPFARAGAGASIALIGMLLSANAAFAATVIGSAATDSYVCPGGYDTVQLSWSSGTYAVPPLGGAITSWSTLAGPGAGQVGLQVWRPSTTVPGAYVLVGASPLVTPTTALVLNDIPLTTPIPVQAGDLIGLRIQDPAYCQALSSVTDIYGSKVVPTNPALGAIDTFLGNKYYQLDVAATVGAVVTPPPPPPSGCDSTNNSTDTSNGGSTDNSATSPADTSAAVTADASNGGSTDNSATSPADSSVAVTADASTGAPADTSNVDATDKSAKDATDKSKKDKSKKDRSDHSTGGDNCQQ
jgi:hypothetical protein